MDVEQWEFCKLDYDGRSEQRGGKKYDLWIVYMYQGEDVRQLASTEREGRLFVYNPFYAAIGLLGTFGWEIISTQHETNSAGAINWQRAVVYFKRRIKPGRRIDYPALMLS